jgi:hypothetical protein
MSQPAAPHKAGGQKCRYSCRYGIRAGLAMRGELVPFRMVHSLPAGNRGKLQKYGSANRP